MTGRRSDAVCKAVFGRLLPEEGQRTTVAAALGVSPDNPVRLQQALGGDVARELAFLPEEEASPVPELAHLAQARDGTGGLTRTRADARRGGGARLSLASGEGKLPVVLVDGRIAVPRPGEPATHLIQLEPTRFPGFGTTTEMFCRALGSAAGLARGAWE